MYSKSISSVSTSGTGFPNYLERMTYPQVEQLATRTELALLPIGPPEAHGPHLPIGTDLIAARELCERAALALTSRGIECLVAPLLADICRGLARSGFRRILVVSGHAEEENLAVLRAGAEQAEKVGALVE